eukprot:6190825-Pleurochrysis_carterae.AAC.1
MFCARICVGAEEQSFTGWCFLRSAGAIGRALMWPAPGACASAGPPAHGAEPSRADVIAERTSRADGRADATADAMTTGPVS